MAAIRERSGWGSSGAFAAVCVALLASGCCLRVPLEGVFERDGLILPRGTLREGPGCEAFTIGETTLDEVLERMAVAPDRLVRDPQRGTVATWDTGGFRMDGESEPARWVWTPIYFLQCAFDAHGILTACTEYGPMPDPEAIRSHCGVESDHD